MPILLGEVCLHAQYERSDSYAGLHVLATVSCTLQQTGFLCKIAGPLNLGIALIDEVSCVQHARYKRPNMRVG
jgi:hypothetical protein